MYKKMFYFFFIVLFLNTAIFSSDDIKKEPDEKDYILQMSGGLFVTGFVVHILCEAFGFNRWYCNNGHACNSNKNFQ